MINRISKIYYSSDIVISRSLSIIYYKGDMINMPTDTTLTASTYQDHFNEFTPSVFKNELFGNLNVLKDSSGKLWFIGIEVAQMLGYKDPSRAIRYAIPAHEKQIVNMSKYPVNFTGYSQGRGNSNKTLISEQGLIELINRSELNNPIIRQFKDWVINYLL